MIDNLREKILSCAQYICYIYIYIYFFFLCQVNWSLSLYFTNQLWNLPSHHVDHAWKTTALLIVSWTTHSSLDDQKCNGTSCVIMKTMALLTHLMNKLDIFHHIDFLAAMIYMENGLNPTIWMLKYDLKHQILTCHWRDTFPCAC